MPRASLLVAHWKRGSVPTASAEGDEMNSRYRSNANMMGLLLGAASILTGESTLERVVGDAMERLPEPPRGYDVVDYDVVAIAKAEAKRVRKSARRAR